MHIVVSWDVSATSPRWNEIDQQLRERLGPLPWVRPLSTFYIVQISSEFDRLVLRDRLNDLADRTTETIHIVISPAMSGGRYDGYLPADTWPTINARTDS